MPKKHGFKILSGLFGGFGDAASNWLRLKEKKNMSEEDVLNRLSELTLKKQMELLDPQSKVDMEYKQALTEQVRHPRPTDFDKRLSLAQQLNPPSKSFSDLLSPGSIEARPSQPLSLTPPQTGGGTVADLIARGTAQDENYKESIGALLGLPSKKKERLATLMTLFKASDELVNPDQHFKLLNAIVKEIGVAEALNLGFIEQVDIDSGAVEGE